jgi:hypothetical protein
MKVDFYVLGLQILGISSIISAVNFIVTILNMRAPGMRLMRMPIFTWMTLITAVLLAHRDGDHHGRVHAADVRPLLRDAFYDPTKGWRPGAVAAPLLDVRPPRGVHPDPADLRHGLGGAPDLLTEAALRLQRDGLLGDPDRLAGLGRVEPPHVRGGASGRSPTPSSR